MIIQINDDWRIASDPQQWMLQKRNPGAKAGRSLWRNIAYFRDFDRAVAECCRRRVLILVGTYQPEALNPLSNALQRIEEQITAALEGFKTDASAYAGRAGS